MSNKKLALFLACCAAAGITASCNESVEWKANECENGAKSCIDNAVNECKDGEWTVSVQCEGATPYCNSADYTCTGTAPVTCTEGQAKCEENVLKVCSNNTWTSTPCNDKTCDAVNKTCAENVPACEAGCKDGKNVTCNEAGEAVVDDCNYGCNEAGNACAEAKKCKDGNDVEYNDGDKICKTDTLITECKNGEWVDVNTECSGDTPVCEDGACVAAATPKCNPYTKDDGTPVQLKNGETMCDNEVLVSCTITDGVAGDATSKDCTLSESGERLEGVTCGADPNDSTKFACVPLVPQKDCEDGEVKCEGVDGVDTMFSCGTDNKWVQGNACEAGKVCGTVKDDNDNDVDACVDDPNAKCTEGAKKCDGDLIATCDAEGAWGTAVACENTGEVCVEDATDGAKCAAPAKCTVGTGSDAVEYNHGDKICTSDTEISECVNGVVTPLNTTCSGDKPVCAGGECVECVNDDVKDCVVSVDEDGYAKYDIKKCVNNAWTDANCPDEMICNADGSECVDPATVLDCGNDYYVCANVGSTPYFVACFGGEVYPDACVGDKTVCDIDIQGCKEPSSSCLCTEDTLINATCGQNPAYSTGYTYLKLGTSLACKADCSDVDYSNCVILDEEPECGVVGLENVTCEDYDSEKTWAENGVPGCDNYVLTQGTCVEAGPVVTKYTTIKSIKDDYDAIKATTGKESVDISGVVTAVASDKKAFVMQDADGTADAAGIYVYCGSECAPVVEVGNNVTVKSDKQPQIFSSLLEVVSPVTEIVLASAVVTPVEKTIADVLANGAKNSYESMLVTIKGVQVDELLKNTSDELKDISLTDGSDVIYVSTKFNGESLDWFSEDFKYDVTGTVYVFKRKVTGASDSADVTHIGVRTTADVVAVGCVDSEATFTAATETTDAKCEKAAPEVCTEANKDTFCAATIDALTTNKEKAVAACDGDACTFTCTEGTKISSGCLICGEHMVVDGESCKCDADNHYVADGTTCTLVECKAEDGKKYDSTGVACECDADNHYTGDGTTCTLVECKAEDGKKYAADGISCECAEGYSPEAGSSPLVCIKDEDTNTCDSIVDHYRCNDGGIREVCHSNVWTLELCEPVDHALVTCDEDATNYCNIECTALEHYKLNATGTACEEVICGTGEKYAADNISCECDNSNSYYGTVGSCVQCLASDNKEWNGSACVCAANFHDEGGVCVANCTHNECSGMQIRICNEETGVLAAASDCTGSVTNGAYSCDDVTNACVQSGCVSGFAGANCECDLSVNDYVDGSCIEHSSVCSANAWSCDADGVLKHCNNNGTGYVAADTQSCGVGLCNATEHKCNEPLVTICDPESYECDGKDLKQCNAAGTAYSVIETCEATEVCHIKPDFGHHHEEMGGAHELESACHPACPDYGGNLIYNNRGCASENVESFCLGNGWDEGNMNNCGAYICSLATGECLRSCTSNDDCYGTNICNGGECVLTGCETGYHLNGNVCEADCTAGEFVECSNDGLKKVVKKTDCTTEEVECGTGSVCDANASSSNYCVAAASQITCTANNTKYNQGTTMCVDGDVQFCEGQDQWSITTDCQWGCDQAACLPQCSGTDVSNCGKPEEGSYYICTNNNTCELQTCDAAKGLKVNADNNACECIVEGYTCNGTTSIFCTNGESVGDACTGNTGICWASDNNVDGGCGQCVQDTDCTAGEHEVAKCDTTNHTCSVACADGYVKDNNGACQLVECVFNSLDTNNKAGYAQVKKINADVIGDLRCGDLNNAVSTWTPQIEASINSGATGVAAANAEYMASYDGQLEAGSYACAFVFAYNDGKYVCMPGASDSTWTAPVKIEADTKLTEAQTRALVVEGGNDNACSTEGATKCGEGDNANKLYTCSDSLVWETEDCAANDSGKVCGETATTGVYGCIDAWTSIVNAPEKYEVCAVVESACDCEGKYLSLEFKSNKCQNVGPTSSPISINSTSGTRYVNDGYILISGNSESFDSHDKIINASKYLELTLNSDEIARMTGKTKMRASFTWNAKSEQYKYIGVVFMNGDNVINYAYMENTNGGTAADVDFVMDPITIPNTYTSLKLRVFGYALTSDEVALFTQQLKFKGINIEVM